MTKKNNFLNELKDKKQSEVFQILKEKIFEFRTFILLNKKKTKEFKNLKLHIANLKNYIKQK